MQTLVTTRGFDYTIFNVGHAFHMGLEYIDYNVGHDPLSINVETY